MTYSGRILKSLSLLAVLAAAGCAGQKPTSQTQSGTYSITYENVSALVGVHAGTGRLILESLIQKFLHNIKFLPADE